MTMLILDIIVLVIFTEVTMHGKIVMGKIKSIFESCVEGK